ncbi:hypothetical protein GCM10008174_09860 [Methylopila turkensis]|uniref:Uncharacterized protein n=1 Tax=Methylopila turkensis TaxID=1437816 RepID=A0A9W6JKB7_9HYPH|nr:hypothetical protein GCM10008174_09860 [Methylopila turkensis]
MRVGGVLLVSVVLGAAPALAADPPERGLRERPVERYRVTRAAEAYYGPQVALPGSADQIVVTRGPRLLLEDDGTGLFPPEFTSRRLPSRVRRVRVNADVPLYEAYEAEEAEPRRGRR